VAIVTRKNFSVDIDKPKRGLDSQQRLLEQALREKENIKNTSLSRLHGIKTEIIYYEQIIEDRKGNLANNASLNSFDPNLTRFRKITDLVILTDELDSQLDKDVFTNLTFEGSAKILPHTIIPNINDFFIMKVFEENHLFKIIEINPVLIEKDSGYEIRFSLYRQNIIAENCELNINVKETYTFDYNHVGTEFRTILRTDENDFIQKSREIMYSLMKVYVDMFYHRTLNTFLIETGLFPDNIKEYLTNATENNRIPMIGNCLLENRSLYDIQLMHFINKFNINSPSENVHLITEHLKPNKKWYNNSIFSAIENMEIDRFKNDKQLIMYANSNLHSNTNRLYGRFVIYHIPTCDPDGEVCVIGDWLNSYSIKDASNYFTLDLFPIDFTSILRSYDSDLMYNRSPDYEYESIIKLFIDMISTFISEKDLSRKRSIILRLVNIIYDKYINFIYEDDIESPYDIFYIYPLVVYVLKYMTREISSREFK